MCSDNCGAWRLIFLIALSTFIIETLGGVAADSVCGDDDWLIYEDEKCFKVVNQLVTFEEAKGICGKDSLGIYPIVTVNSAAEQDFLTNIVFNDKGVEDDIWLGALRSNSNISEFEWADRSKLEYTNWKQGSPSLNTKRNCTVMDTNGFWLDVSCGKRNLVVCQKRQKWSLTYAQKMILQLRQEMSKSLNPVPQGFIYMQLSNQLEPKVLWPKLSWTEVTSFYSGQFFRVEGSANDSFKFEVVENDTDIKMNKVNSWAGKKETADSTQLAKEGLSRPLPARNHRNDGGKRYTQFNSAPVKQKNTAVRVWRRN